MKTAYLTTTVLLLTAACQPTQDRQFLTVGPGVALHDSQPASADETARERLQRDTADIETYFAELCKQLGEAADCYENHQTPNWRALVHTGYNDIDLRCDRYLNWVDRKRSEERFANTGTVALSGLLGGVLGIAAPGTAALAYLPLVFDFTQDVYSAYQTAILFGLESSTVKSIVNQRRYQHREQFKAVQIVDRPSAIYAMREYLMICTPQSIVQDVNTYSRRAAVEGGNAAQTDAAQAASVAPAPRADMNAPE